MHALQLQRRADDMTPIACLSHLSVANLTHDHVPPKNKKDSKADGVVSPARSLTPPLQTMPCHPLPVLDVLFKGAESRGSPEPANREPRGSSSAQPLLARVPQLGDEWPNDARACAGSWVRVLKKCPHRSVVTAGGAARRCCHRLSAVLTSCTG
ncbi:hypothetical protein BKA80DRAFT_270969 [Phyllosticta citrichinensis]